MDELECYTCDAVFMVEHDQDPEYYRITHCPFCGTKITTVEEDLDWKDWDEDE